MLVIVAYDIDTTTGAGERRLRRVAKVCEQYGCRVQNSVFEVLLDCTEQEILMGRLSRIIDKEKDSIRFYSLGNNWKSRINSIGRGITFEQDDVIIL